MAKRTKEDVERLKRQWSLDPCFELDSIEGYEEFQQELHLFQVETELRWARNEVTLLRSAITMYRNAHNALMKL